MPSDTIPRNSRQIPGLRERLTVCKRYDADNQYTGQPVDPKHAWEKLLGDQTRRSRLSFDGDGVYTIHVHGRLWYELREAEPGHVSTDARRRVRAVEGSRDGQRGIVAGPPEQSIWLPITWDDGRTETYHAAAVATVTDDPACAAGDGCHMRFDGTVWYAIDSEVAAHGHELPGWAREEHEVDRGRLEEAAHARGWELRSEHRPAPSLVADHLRPGYPVPLTGKTSASAELAQSGLRAGDAIEIGSDRTLHDAGHDLYHAARAAAEGTSTPVSWAGERVAAVVPLGWDDAYNLWPEPGAAGPGLAPPEPTEASIAAVLTEAGIMADAVGGEALIRRVVTIALKRGYVRGHEDTLAELADEDDEPARAMPAVIELADRDDPRYPWRLAWAGGTRWRDFQRQGLAAADYYAMTERPCAVYERREPDGRWYRTGLHKRAPR